MLHTKLQLIIVSWKSKWKYLFALLSENEPKDSEFRTIGVCLENHHSQKMLSTSLTYPGETVSDSEACPCGPVLNYQLFHSHDR